MRPLLDVTRPEDSLARLAAVSVDINTRTAPIYRILVSAASSDTDAAAILDELTRQRQEGQGRVATALARAKALRPGLRAQDAGDVIHALASPELYHLLVIDRAWSPERYERWLAEHARRPTTPLDYGSHAARRRRRGTGTERWPAILSSPCSLSFNFEGGH